MTPSVGPEAEPMPDAAEVPRVYRQEWNGLETPEIAPGRSVSIEALGARGGPVGASPVVRA